MSTMKQSSSPALPAPLRNGKIRQTNRDGRTLYAAVDVVAALTNPSDAAGTWSELKRHEPAVAALCVAVVFDDGQQQALPQVEEAVATDAVDLEGMLRLVQSVHSSKAERLRKWLAQSARERVEEAENPELAVLRTRRLYEQQGYSRRWVDKRLRGVSARHELTGEWFKRGATESDQFRVLTNDLMRGAFGMEVEEYRRFKNLFKTGENLRDHMSDVELALTALGETVAVELHRQRNSRSFEQLDADARDAGDMVSRVRAGHRDADRPPDRAAGEPPWVVGGLQPPTERGGWSRGEGAAWQGCRFDGNRFGSCTRWSGGENVVA
jgi:hypothetical protein